MAVNQNYNIWSPSYFGQLCTRSPDWMLTIKEDKYFFRIGNSNCSGSVLEFKHLKINKGLFWSDFDWTDPRGNEHHLDGLPNSEAAMLFLSVNQIINTEIRNREIAEKTLFFKEALEEILIWHQTIQQKIDTRLTSKGWLSQSFIKELLVDKPSLEINLNDSDFVSIIKALPTNQLNVFRLWQSDLRNYVDGVNQQQLNVVGKDLSQFFSSIEKSPLSEEQIKAVVCFDDRVLLVASAGSGKTSTMVAKCGYAIHQNYFKPEQILLLAFNDDVAEEMQSRIKKQFAKHNIPTNKITAKTFHSFGLDVIGICTGKRPHPPSWLVNGKTNEILSNLIDELKDKNPTFRTMWDLFRIVIYKDMPAFGDEEENPEWRDTDKNKTGFWTFNNELVKSRGELLIANWLFYNGINYQYEPSYKHDTADASFRQYTPDFYFPDIDLYYEHWALDENGNPPESFIGYADGMRWKKSIHAKYGTDLIETTMAQLWSGEAFEILRDELTKRGVKLDPNPDRPTAGRKVIQNERLIKLFRTFLSHVKNNRHSMSDLRYKLNTSNIGKFKFRYHIFLVLFESIWNAWDKKLQSEGAVDFDDMLNMAADHIEQGRYQSPFQLVMVDEFQDVSQSRARLVRGLLKKPEQYLFAVGDDWQSINRFAGSYIGCMTDFEGNFGQSTILKLENTYRCPQSLCDISSQFIQRNPVQIKKGVRSAVPNIEKPIKIIRVSDVDLIQTAITSYMQELSTSNINKIKQSIFLLGRHRDEKVFLPKSYDRNYISIEFKTVHSSKGLEADHIIIPNMIDDTLGFPNQIEDDPILSLAMPEVDNFAFSEERRLFYVALTRARSKVVLITVEKKESPFVLELAKQHGLEFHDMKGQSQALSVCPKCNRGLIIEKDGPFGFYKICTKAPLCDYKPPKAKVGVKQN